MSGLAELEWDLIPYTPQSALMHMALDETLLQKVIAGERRPTVRFWEWIEPALVIGSHQSVVNEVDTLAAQNLWFNIARWVSGASPPHSQPRRPMTYQLYFSATYTA